MLLAKLFKLFPVLFPFSFQAPLYTFGVSPEVVKLFWVFLLS